jgi:glutathione S-transferase
VFGPVFRYFDVFETLGDFGVLDALPKVEAWRRALSSRPSMAGSVTPDYPQRLVEFLRARGSHMSRLTRTAA